jgi:hypothetical protein
MSDHKLSAEYRRMLDQDPPEKKENEELLRRAYTGTDEDKWVVVTRNARMVLWVISRHFSDKTSNDTFSDGLWGLFTAVSRLKENCSVQEFFGYSHKYIMGYVQQGVIQRGSQLAKFRYTNRREISLDQFDGTDDDSVKMEIENPNEASPVDMLGREDAGLYSESLIEFICDHPALRLTDLQKERFRLLARHGGNLSSAAREAGVSAERMRVIKVLVEERLFRLIDSHPGLQHQLEATYGIPNVRQYSKTIRQVEPAEDAPVDDEASRQAQVTYLDPVSVEYLESA